MSLENILREIKKAAVTVSLPVALLSSGPIMAQPSGPKVTNNYKINAETIDTPVMNLHNILNFAEAKFSVREGNDEYEISGSMDGKYVHYNSKMRFNVKGYLRNGKYFPRRYDMEFTHDSTMNSEGTIRTIINFNYANQRAFPYSRHITKNHMLYDTRPNGIAIDDSVKDIISGIMDLRVSMPTSNTPINTIINGARATYNVNYEGPETIRHQRVPVNCNTYSMIVPRDIIDSNQYRFKFWITQRGTRTPLKIRIQPGRSTLWAVHQSTRRE